MIFKNFPFDFRQLNLTLSLKACRFSITCRLDRLYVLHDPLLRSLCDSSSESLWRRLNR